MFATCSRVIWVAHLCPRMLDVRFTISGSWFYFHGPFHFTTLLTYSSISIPFNFTFVRTLCQRAEWTWYACVPVRISLWSAPTHFSEIQALIKQVTSQRLITPVVQYIQFHESFFFFFGLSVFSSLCLVKPFDLLEPYCLLSIWQVSLCLSMRPSSTSDNFMNFISYLSNCVFKARKQRGRDALPTARLNHYLNVMHAMPLPSRRADTGEYNHMWSVKLIKFNLSPIL